MYLKQFFTYLQSLLSMLGFYKKFLETYSYALTCRESYSWSLFDKS